MTSPSTPRLRRLWLSAAAPAHRPIVALVGLTVAVAATAMGMAS